MSNSDVFDGTTFASGFFSSQVTLSGNTATVNTVDSSGSWTLTGTITIAGDTVSATFDNGVGGGFTETLTAVFDFNGGIVFQDSGQNTTYLFSTTPLNSTDSFPGATGFGNDDPSGGGNTACYVAGTRIATERGPVAVEHLRRGDRVRTLLGRGYAPVIWTGRREVRCGSHPQPHEVWPVRIAAGAFGPGLPVRDLLVSPGHAIFTDGGLVPASLLLNGATIRQVPTETVRYHHFELPTHEVVLAEGLPAESYIDAGNRSSFADAGKVVMAIPNFTPDLATDATGHSIPRRCAPWLQETPALRLLRVRLRARAIALGYQDTDDADLRLETIQNGGRVPLASQRNGTTLQAVLPAGAATVRLLSRSAVPAEQVEGSGDQRRLGVAVARILLDGIDLPLDDPRLGLGWQGMEPGRRWTNGHATLVLAPAAGPRRLEIIMQPLLRYWHAGPVAPSMPIPVRPAVVQAVAVQGFRQRDRALAG